MRNCGRIGLMPAGLALAVWGPWRCSGRLAGDSYLGGLLAVPATLSEALEAAFSVEPCGTHLQLLVQGG